MFIHSHSLNSANPCPLPRLHLHSSTTITHSPTLDRVCGQPLWLLAPGCWLLARTAPEAEPAGGRVVGTAGPDALRATGRTLDSADASTARRTTRGLDGLIGWVHWMGGLDWWNGRMYLTGGLGLRIGWVDWMG